MFNGPENFGRGPNVVRPTHNNFWYSENMPNTREIFMPEGLCARCGEQEPTLYEIFRDRKDDAAPDNISNTRLGFCSQDCFKAFCAGIKVLARAV